MKQPYGISQDIRLIPALLPENAKIDERELSDLLAYIARYASNIPFYDLHEKYNPEKDWGTFLISDISIILADILHKNTQKVDKKRIDLVGVLQDNFSTNNKQLEALSAYIELSEDVYNQFELWQKFFKSNRRTFWTTSSPIEREIDFLMGQKFPELFDKLQEIKRQAQENKKADIHELTKGMTAIYRVFYTSLVHVKSITPRFFEESLSKKNDHAPPMGLLIAFANLFRYAQDHLNGLTEKHLEYYYKDILGLKPRPEKPDELYVYFEPGELEDSYVLKKGTRLLGKRNKLGINPVYETCEDLQLSHTKIGALKTLFVSKDDKINMGSSYTLVANIFAAPVANSQDGEGKEFRKSPEWAILGEEQLGKAPDEKTMPKARIGFVISSPVLFLQSGERSISAVFEFSKDSMKNYRMLMEDLCKKLPLSFSDVFHKVFKESFTIQMSGEAGWVNIDRYEVIPPASILENRFEIKFMLGAHDEAIVANNPEVHDVGADLDTPLLKIKLGGAKANYVYSFVENFRLEKITINVDVKQIKNLDLYNNIGKIDGSLPFVPFGPIPTEGAYLAIGYSEAFRKELTDLTINIDWLNLPKHPNGFADHYSAYDLGWENETFQVELTALTNSVYSPAQGAPPLTYSLFENESEESNRIKTSTQISDVDLAALDIHPDYALQPVLNLDNNTRSGFFKLELANPPEAFGHEIYPRLFTKVVTENALPPSWKLLGVAEGKRDTKPLPLEPYSPMIKELSMSYSASSTINLGMFEAEDRDVSSPEHIIHLHPFGFQEVFSMGRILNNDFIPKFNEEGYLYIGLIDVNPRHPLSPVCRNGSQYQGFHEHEANKPKVELLV